MTFAVGHVEGGTHAGWRRTRQKPGPWACACFAVKREPRGRPREEMNPGYLTRCPDCKAERP